MMQESIVALIVAYAAWVVARRYAPKPVRQWVRAWKVRVATRLGWTRIAAKFDVSDSGASSCADGCGTCGSCDSAGTKPAVKQFAITPEALKQTIKR
jgi:hypothetical protein